MSLTHLAAAFVVMTAGAAVCGAQTTPDSAPKTPVTKDAPAKDAPAKPARRNRDVITPDEFNAPELRTMTVLDVIRRLRPNFLNSRNTVGGVGDADGATGQVHASLDWHTVMNIEELSSMTLDAVKEIRLLSPAQAQQRFGTSALAGPVILVRTM